MSQRDEVLDDERRAAVVVSDDRVDVRDLRGARQVDDRGRACRLAQRAPPEPRGGADDAVDAKLEQTGERRLLGPLLVFARDDECRVRPRLEHGIESGRELGQEQVAKVGHEDADRVRAAADERPGRGVGVVAELLRRPLDGGAARVTDARGIAEHAGDERLRHACARGDIVDRRGAHRCVRSRRRALLTMFAASFSVHGGGNVPT